MAWSLENRKQKSNLYFKVRLCVGGRKKNWKFDFLTVISRDLFSPRGNKFTKKMSNLPETM